jgi:hypothetical protein
MKIHSGGVNVLKRFLSRLNREAISSEKVQILLCLLILCLVFLYQVLKGPLNLHIEKTSGQVTNVNLPAAFFFIAASALLIVFTPKIALVKNNIAAAAAIFGISFALCASYTLMRGIDWTNLDVPQNSLALAAGVRAQGVSDFIATYNDRGNPGPPGSSAYANQVYDALRFLGMEQMAQAYWVGKMPTNLGRPFMHPPTFFILLAGWQVLFGNTPFSAAIFMWISTALWGVICFILLKAVRPQSAGFLTLLFITLPTTIMDTWFVTYDVACGMLLLLGFGLAVLAASKKSRGLYFLSGLALGASIMFRLTALFFVALVPLALLYLVARRLQPASSLWMHGLGLLLFPTAFWAAGYNPVLTIITAKFRQDTFYAAHPTPFIFRLPEILYLGIPILVLIAFGVFKHFSALVKSNSAIWVFLPLVAMIPIAITTRLTADFHRNMLGISACFLLGISLSENWPQSRFYQALYVGSNISFVLLRTLL